MFVFKQNNEMKKNVLILNSSITSGSEELFKDLCSGDLASYIHAKVYFSGLVEGWGLYAENPVLSDDVGLYKNNLLQELGMYKGQVFKVKFLFDITMLIIYNKSKLKQCLFK